MSETLSRTVKTNYDLDEFDLVLVTAPDIHGVARGRFLFKPSLKGFVKNGLGIAQASLFSGVQCDVPLVLVEYSKEGWASGTLIPDMSTLRPLSYLSYGDKKVGQVICDFLSFTGERETSMSREVALDQVKALKNLGYEISVSFELELTIFKKGSLQPVGVNENLDSFLNKILTTFWESGIPVVSVGRGTEFGKIQITVEAEKGIEAADSLHRLRNILKSVCVNSGYDTTYMTKPLPGFTKNSFHYIMTLTNEQGSNVLTSSNNNNYQLSEIGQHWTAGLLHHSPALTALCRPTVNCYSSETENNEVLATWTTNQSNSSARLQIGNNNEGTYIRDCLPTSACNPYCVLGGIIAAGMAGISNKMSLPSQISSGEQYIQTGPSTLSDALTALETDTAFVMAFSSKFVYRYLLLKREYEIEKFKNIKEDDDLFELERKIYLYYL